MESSLLFKLLDKRPSREEKAREKRRGGRKSLEKGVEEEEESATERLVVVFFGELASREEVAFARVVRTQRAHLALHTLPRVRAFEHENERLVDLVAETLDEKKHGFSLAGMRQTEQPTASQLATVTRD